MDPSRKDVLALAAAAATTEALGLAQQSWSFNARNLKSALFKKRATNVAGIFPQWDGGGVSWFFTRSFKNHDSQGIIHKTMNL